jgi:hypothetical protein
VHDLAEDENAGAMSGTAVQRRQEPTVATVQEYRAVIVDGVNLVWWKLRKVVKGGQDTKVVFTWPAALTQTAEDATMWAQALVGAHSGGLISHEPRPYRGRRRRRVVRVRARGMAMTVYDDLFKGQPIVATRLIVGFDPLLSLFAPQPPERIWPPTSRLTEMMFGVRGDGDDTDA